MKSQNQAMQLKGICVDDVRSECIQSYYAGTFVVILAARNKSTNSICFLYFHFFKILGSYLLF